MTHPHVPFQSDARSVWNVLQTVRGHLAFDIGANGGLVSTEFAGRFDEVIACEPAIESFEQLVETVPENVRPLNVAVSDHTGTITLRETTLTAHLGELFTGDSIPWGGHVGYRDVPSITLDELTVAYGRPDFIKVDTEGHETQVLEGGRATLATKPRLCIEIHSQENGSAIKHLLNEFDIPYTQHDHNRYQNGSPWRVHHYWLVTDEEA
jgi:FkbM family methyltransferase